MKKRNILLVTGLSVIVGGTLASCNSLGGSDNQNTLSKKESFNLEAATSLNLVSSLNNPATLRKFRNIQRVSEQDIAKVQDLLPTIDLILDNGSIFNSTLVEEETVIDGVTYAFKEQITFKNNELKDETYTLIYNKEVIQDKEVDDDDEKETKEEEIETVEILKGLAFIDEETKFDFYSISSNEVESDEQESERLFKINMNETTYVKVEQETEVEEGENSTEFKYTFVENGKKTLEYSLEIEKEGNEEEIEYELGGVEYELKREVVEGETIYKVFIEGQKDDDEVLITFKKIVNEDGTITYVQVN